MKKFSFFLMLTGALSASAQNNKWFVSITNAFVIGGPSASLKNQMREQGFNDSKSYNALGFTGTHHYPNREFYGNILLRAGKKLSSGNSLYFVAGLVDKSKVTGFKYEGSGSFFGAFGGAYGPSPSIHYEIWQVTGGYMFSKDSRAKLGIGPSILVFDYCIDNENQRRLIPGALISGRFPIGKEKNMFGIDLVADLQLAPSAKIKTKSSTAIFKPGDVSMVLASIGVAYTLRKP